MTWLFVSPEIGDTMVGKNKGIRGKSKTCGANKGSQASGIGDEMGSKMNRIQKIGRKGRYGGGRRERMEEMEER